ncbi:MAG: hypothetical protein MI922_14310, partial [Bacteroidales bacterium]|nr:hypothetical protein [Bacteroidales bacterium]
MKTTFKHLLLVLAFISCEKEKEIPSLGQVTVSEVTNYAANISGMVTNDGDSNIDTIGICWALHEMPTVENSTYILENVHSIEYLITNLIPKSKYYVRIFAINEKGLSYSAETSFTTQPNETDVYTDPRDGQKYKTVKIGEKWWFAENLNYHIADSWYFKDDSLNYSTKGRLYTHESATNAIPEGW